MTSPLTLSDAPVTTLPGFRRVFPRGRMTLGIALPLYSGQPDAPGRPGVDVARQVELVRRAEAGGVAAVWVRDIPLRVPDFGDVGQVWDPFAYLGYLAASTSTIALATGAVVVPVRHPLHLAKEATSVDHLSGGRFLFGVATGDRPVEYKAYGLEEGARGDVFRENLEVMNQAWTTENKGIRWSGGRMWGGDIVPKPVAVRPPVLTVGSCLQPMEWHRANADAHVTYHRALTTQQKYLAEWRADGVDKPFAMNIALDLHADPDAEAGPIKFGWSVGARTLVTILRELEDMGVDHCLIGLKRGRRPAEEALDELIELVVPSFSA